MTSPEFRITHYDNADIIRSRFPFRYENYLNPKLVRLREEYELDGIIAQGRTQLEKLVLLRNWLRSLWVHGWSNGCLHWDALDILNGVINRGETPNCGYISSIFIQCCLSLGFQARHIGISKEGSDFYIPGSPDVAHCVAEVWSDEFRKWVVLDPDANSHYERKGTPLSAYEIRSAWITKDETVRCIYGDPKPAWQPIAESFHDEATTTVNFHKFYAHDVKNFYYNIAVLMNNDLISNGDCTYELSWLDRGTPPLLASCSLALDNRKFTTDIRDLYWTLNEVRIHLNPKKACDNFPAPEVGVRLEDSMPNLSHLLVKIDDGEWRRSVSEFDWRLHPGDNTISARGVNSLGFEGPVSVITVINGL